MITVYDNMRDGYIDLVRFLLRNGESVAPRGIPTRELSPGYIVLTRPWDVLATGVGRKLVPAIGYAEGLQLIAGVSTPDLLVRIAPEFARFREDDGTFWGAYGLRVAQQTMNVVRLLARDPDTRQAVITIFDGERDLIPNTEQTKKDIPCTIGLHFLLRNRGLDLHTYMRSNDVWRGLPYDVVQFTMLQMAVANALDVPVGYYHHHATSLHLYDSDRDAADALHRINTEARHNVEAERWSNYSVGRRGVHSWEEIRDRARRLLEGRTIKNPTKSEIYYADVLRPYQ